MFGNIYSIYSVGHKMIKHHIPVIPKLLNIVKRLIFPACDIPFSAEIGEGAYFPHRAIGVVIHGRAVIGKNAKIESNVTIGGKHDDGVPVIGDNCFIGTGACIVGGVLVGDDCMIGAGAVVVKDVPPRSVVVGVPGVVVKHVPDETIGKRKG